MCTVIWPAGIDVADYRQNRPSEAFERALGHVPATEVGNAMVPIVRHSMGIEIDELLGPPCASSVPSA
jgi:hypothetical protein